MVEITDRQIELISGEIDQQGLTFVDLKNEILDHICCQIEIEMEQGVTFNEAYRKVRIQMGLKRIRQIQDETLNLISKKYRRMKRVMYVMGVAAPLLVIVAAILKIFHWPGGGLVMTVALFVTGMMFLPLFVLSRIRDTRRRAETVPMGMYITGMIAGMLTILGALFKIQHWPGASVALTVGLGSLALIFLPVYATAKIREAREKQTEINKRLLFGGIIAGGLLILGVLFKIMHWPGAGFVILISWSAVAVVFIPLLVLNQLREPENRINNFFNVLLVVTATAVFIMALLRSAPREVIRGFLLPEKHISTMASMMSERNTLLWNDLPDSGDYKASLANLQQQSDEICAYVQELRRDLARELSYEEDNPVDADGNVDLYKVGYVENNSKAYHRIADVDSYKLYHQLESFRSEALALTNNQKLVDYMKAQTTWYDSDSDEEPEEAWVKAYFLGPFLQSAAVLSMVEASVQMILHELLMEFHDPGVGS